MDNEEKVTRSKLAAAFSSWWAQHYDYAPGAAVVSMATTWGAFLLSLTPPPPSAELVAEWSDLANGGGEASLAGADQQLAHMAAVWGKRWFEVEGLV